MPDEHVPTREIVDVDDQGNSRPGPASYAAAGPLDPLIAFFWARLDEETPEPHGDEFLPPSRAVRDLAAKRAILDDYARACADLENPARQLICQITRDVIKRLATVYDGHPDYTEDFRP